MKSDAESRAAGVRAAFDAIDTDSDGLLSRSELRYVISGLRGPETPPSEVEDAVNAAFARLDKNRDGSISFEEFSAATAPFSRDTLRAAFNLFDTDRSGSITMNEFTAMLDRLGLCPRSGAPQAEGAPSQEVAALFQAADKDSDGSVSFEEFISLLPIAAQRSKQQSDTLWRKQRQRHSVARHSQSTLVETFKLARERALTA
jgi:Ca2+-binding EF-hand superfamily protein